jgi:23S rRNA (guanine745-N1)-methyltransferase
MWQCPLCKDPFLDIDSASAKLENKTLQCANKHSFDRAKQGYFNLLPVQHKNSKTPGDDEGMVQARRRFFESAPYMPLVESIAACINTYLRESHSENSALTNEEPKKPAIKVPRNPCACTGSPIKIYDSGCGEGFYLNTLSAILPDNYQFAGHDISKAAIIAAAKKNKDKQLVVASTINIPLQDNAVDVVYQIFAPSCPDEYRRILHHHGLLIVVEPASEHLFEIKQKVYDKPEKHQVAEAGIVGFSLLEEKIITFPVNLESAEIRLALLQMTPFYWRATDESKAQIENELHSVTASFVLRVYQNSKGTHV